jgi:hypothetical protein
MAGNKRIYGTTYDVYLCILTSNSPVGVREIWRALTLSSPSLAQYHVNKLMELKLIEPQAGKYVTNDQEQLEALRSFLMLRGMLIPRMVVYAALSAGILTSFLLLYPISWDFRDLVTVAVCLFSIATFSFEAITQYRGLTVWKKED